jgi:hypothetical protein
MARRKMWGEEIIKKLAISAMRHGMSNLVGKSALSM